MKYENAISNLNNIDSDELKIKIDALKSGNTECFDETVGFLFSALRKVKSEELYRIIKSGDNAPKSFDEIFFDENSKFGRDYLTLCNNPIVPFLNENVAEGDKISLLTYRKVSDEDMPAVMVDGFYNSQNVFEILKNDGITETGWNNYIAICEFAHNEFTKTDKNFSLLKKITDMYGRESETGAFCYSDEVSDYNIVNNKIIEKYYSCTSIIYCRLVSVENGGEKVIIEPLLHNTAKIAKGEEIEYDDFGEVGNFSFEMNDYE